MNTQTHLKHKGKWRIGAVVLALLLALSLVVGSLLQSVNTVSAEKVSDSSTRLEYQTALGENQSTQYNGRIWTDKSVSSTDVEFTGDVNDGNGYTVTLGQDEDFLVTYSALATSTAISGQSQAPLDVVFVIDISGSMSNDDSYMDNGQRRIEVLVDALNDSIETLMAMNEYNRIAVVSYSDGATTLLPLAHYEKATEQNWWTGQEYEVDYFSVDGAGDDTTLGYRAVNTSTNREINDDISATGGTNIHMGMDTGMDILTSTNETTVTIGGQTISRIPALILLSDGSPTYSGADTSGQGWNQRTVSWWDPSGRDGTGYSAGQGRDYDQGDAAYEKFAMKTIMNASYNKQLVNEHYGVTDSASDYAMRVYTVGVGIEELSDSTDYHAAQIALDPAGHLNDNNTIANAIRNQWNRYLNNQTATLDGYTFQHPTSGDITSVAYNDGYYGAENAAQVADIFENIVNEISLSAPQVPTQITDGDAHNSGYLTYTDQIGEYMEVKSVKSIVYGGNVFYNTGSTTSADGNTTTYQFATRNGSTIIDSGTYGNINVSLIEVTVTNNADGTQTLTVNMPASAIPVRVNEILLGENEQGDEYVVSNTSNNLYPIRVNYAVGLSVDETTLEGVSSEYLAAHTQNGLVSFYSNYYSGENEGLNGTAGDTYVTFTPSSTNPFYYIQEDTPLYLDEDLTIPATGQIDPDTTYYSSSPYYQGTTIIPNVVARRGTTLAGYTTVVNGQLHIAAGTPRLGGNFDFGDQKDGGNTTDTADYVNYPVINNETGEIITYLGNNGVLTTQAPASLTIAKNVTTGEGQTAPDAQFSFTVTVPGLAGQTVTAIHTIPAQTPGGQATTETVQVSFNDSGVATITLQAGESLELLAMQNQRYTILENTGYTVNGESRTNGFTLTGITGADTNSVADRTASGTVGAAGSEDEVVTFTNNYTATPTTLSGSTNLRVTKNLVGRDWLEGDSFTVNLRAVTSGAPMPAQSSVVLTNENPSASFGDITYTALGTYVYQISESRGNLVGMDYEEGYYLVTVTVEDQQGALVVTNVAYQFVEGTSSDYDYADSGAMVITNEFTADSATTRLAGTKILTGRDLDFHEFTFQLVSVTVDEGTAGAVTYTSGTPEGVPLPSQVSAIGGTITNGGTAEQTASNIYFGDITFTGDNVGHTYTYTIQEMAGSLGGVTYDTAPVSVTYAVSSGVVEGNPAVTVVVTNDESASGVTTGANFIIENTYQPDDVVLSEDTDTGISVQKTFTGRTWTANDQFIFTIVNISAPDGVTAPMPEGGNTVTIGSPADGTVNTAVFGDMTFDTVGTYVYGIQETSMTSTGGIAADGHIARVTVVVSDPGDGQLVAQVTYDNSAATTDADRSETDLAAFTNTYTPTWADGNDVSVDITKNLTVTGSDNVSLTEGLVYFVVSAQDDAPLPGAGSGSNLYVPVSAATDGSNSSITEIFSNLTFDADDLAGATEKDFVYLVSEYQGVRPGMSYDSSVYQVTITVTDDGNGNLNADTAIVKGTLQDGAFVADADQSGVTGIVFNNTYQPASVTTSSGLTLNKTFTGDRNTGLQAGEFSFTMALTSATPQDGIQLPDTLTVSNQADGVVRFDSITFTKEGTYVVSITENIPENATQNEDGSYTLDGVTYDTHTYTITYTVTDRNGQLVVSVGTRGSANFTNEYNTTGILSGSANLMVTKAIDGRDWREGDSFTFTLAANNTQTQTAIENGSVVMPQSNTVTITDATSNHQTAFGDITFTAPGNYEFVITENTPETALPGMSYDTNRHVVTVVATDNGDGTLSIAVQQGSSTNPTFTNTYTPNSVVNTPLGVTKVLEGRDPGLQAGEFTFEMSVSAQAGSPANGFTLPASTTAANAANGSVTFGNITFTQPGVYDVTVREVIPAEQAPFMEYDNHVFTYTVTVTDNTATGELEAVVSGVEEGEATFTNTYTPEDDTKTVNKTVDGITTDVNGKLVGVGDELTYTIHWVNDALNDQGQSVASAVTVTDVLPDGTEFVSASNGGSYDETTGRVTWSLGTQQAGATGDVTMTVRITEDAVHYDSISNTAGIQLGENNPKYTNEVESFVPEKSVDDLQNNTAQVGEVLTYTISYLNTEETDATVVIRDTLSNGLTYTGVPEGQAAPTVTTESGSTVLTWTLEGVQPGTGGEIVFYATVNENAVTIDSITNQASVQIGDDPAVDTNTTTTTVESGSLAISKEVVSTDPGVSIDTQKSFTFTIALTDVNDQPLTGSYSYTIGNGDAQTLTLNAQGQATIQLKHGETATITGLPDGAQYTVTEEAPGNGYTVDSENATGSISANGTAAVTFTNTYTPDEVIVGGEDGIAGITVEKTLVGRDWQNGDSFTFTLTPVGNAPASSNGSVTITNSTAGYEAAFGDITFDAAGEYQYTVSETQGSLGGVTYDTHTATVTVTVTDTDHDGELEAQVSYDNRTAITDADRAVTDAAAFTNSYDAADFVDVPVNFSLTKVLEGKDWEDSDSFQFELTAVTPDAPMPADSVITVSKPAAGNTASFNFGSITYTTPNVYQYVVREIAGSNAGMTYSGNVAEITVTVVDGLDGHLYATAAVTNGTFTNTYSTDVDYVAKGGANIVKNLTGHDLAAGQFTFTVTPNDDASAAKAGINGSKEITTTAATMTDGTATATMPIFSSLTFDQSDDGATYTYTVSETAGGGAGYTNDTTVYTVTITVTDNGEGTLTVNTAVSDGTNTTNYTYTNHDQAPAAVPTLTFNNSYTSSGELGGSGTVSIQATKTLTGRPMVADEFTFNVANVNDPDTVVSTGANAAANDGAAAGITFTPISYTTESLLADAANGLATSQFNENGNRVYTYNYTVSESDEMDAGVAMVTDSFQITVTVTDNGDGTLDIQVTYPEGGLSFVNTYGQDAQADITVNGAKVLDAAEGLSAPDITGKFTFTIQGSEGAPMPQNTTAVNDEAGNVSFGTITYTMENTFGVSDTQTMSEVRSRTFTYTVTESGSVDGVINDQSSSKTFTVTVTDNGDGTLSVESDPESGAYFTFTNTYQVEELTSSVTDQINLNKVLEGRDLSEGEFSFQLMDLDGNVVATGSNGEDGSVVMSSITFTQPGIYNYTLTEVNNELGGVTYDSTVYQIVATVTDQSNGTMAVEWIALDADGNEVDLTNGLSFENRYEAAPTSVSIGAIKRLDGRALTAGEFRFELKDENGQVVATAVNDENGTIQFEELTYTQAGTYVYTLSEVQGNDANVTYDNTVYTITVQVTDDGQGNLVAAMDMGEEDLIFSNSYLPPDPTPVPQTSDPAPLMVLGSAMLLAMLVAAGAVAMRRKGRR